MDPQEYHLRQQAEAAKTIVAALRESFGGDDLALLADAVEGETDLYEAVDAVLDEIDQTEVLISGLKEKEGQFTSRRRSMEERVKRLRSLIEQAMAVSEQDKLRRPAATLTLRKLAPDVIVLAEADIPAEFFVPQPPPPPKLDKPALKQALNRREEAIKATSSIEDSDERERALAAIAPIPGATLNNGGFSLQIRRA
jgi:hypothetical protein